MFLLQVHWYHPSQETVTLRLACAVTLRISIATAQDGSGGEDPPPPRTLGQKETTPLDLVRASTLPLHKMLTQKYT